MQQTSNQYAAKVRAELPEPGDTPLSHLRHVVAAFADDNADDMPIIATMGIYPDQDKTGLTWGDLRALLAMVNRRQCCRRGGHTCIPAVTLTFDNGARRLHWCAEHADDAEAYRASSDAIQIFS